MGKESDLRAEAPMYKTLLSTPPPFPGMSVKQHPYRMINMKHFLPIHQFVLHLPCGTKFFSAGWTSFEQLALGFKAILK